MGWDIPKGSEPEFSKLEGYASSILATDFLPPYDWILTIKDENPGGVKMPNFEIFAREVQPDRPSIDMTELRICGNVYSIPNMCIKADLTVTARDTRDLVLWKALEELHNKVAIGAGMFNRYSVNVELRTISTGAEFGKWKMMLMKFGSAPFDYTPSQTHIEYPITFMQIMSDSDQLRKDIQRTGDF